MLVEPNKTASNLVSRELRACGYRVTAIRESIDSLSYTVQTKPGMFIATAELDQLKVSIWLVPSGYAGDKSHPLRHSNEPRSRQLGVSGFAAECGPIEEGCETRRRPRRCACTPGIT